MDLLVVRAERDDEVGRRVGTRMPACGFAGGRSALGGAGAVPVCYGRALNFVGFIDETLKAFPRLRATRLHNMMQQRGYEGGIAVLRRHVAEVRSVPRGEVCLRTEGLIGEQARVDRAHVGKLAVSGGEPPPWVFVIVLAHSRAMWPSSCST